MLRLFADHREQVCTVVVVPLVAALIQRWRSRTSRPPRKGKPRPREIQISVKWTD
jgi:hypothetical protein